MGAKDEFERELLDARFGSGTPATWYVGASRAESNEDGSGFNEPTGIGGYQRVTMTNNATNFPAAQTTSGRTVKKTALIRWPDPTVSWGSIVEVGFFKTLTGGSPSVTQLLDEPITASAGNTPVEIPAGEMEIEAD